MTQLDTQIIELRKTLMDIAKWPYQKEREAVFLEVLNFSAMQLDYELIKGEKCQNI